MAFYVGQKVVCVDDSIGEVPPGYRAILDVKRGEVYTIRWYGIAGDFWHDEKPCVRLAEILNRAGVNGDDVPFAAWRFRPVVEKKTDISIFTAMLTPKKVKEPV